MANDIEIRKIFVNKIPEGCGDCPMMQYIDESPVCVAIPPEVWGIEGNPYNMKYRRSDCKLTMWQGSISLKGCEADA